MALTGALGCGKTRTISLIEQFYNPLSGGITFDSKDIRQFYVNNYRKHIALVQQEPVLYSGTIRENILFGTIDPAIEEDMIATEGKYPQFWHVITRWL